MESGSTSSGSNGSALIGLDQSPPENAGPPPSAGKERRHRSCEPPALALGELRGEKSAENSQTDGAGWD